MSQTEIYNEENTNYGSIATTHKQKTKTNNYYSLIGNDNTNQNQLKNATPEQVRNNAAIAAQKRMHSLSKSPQNSNKPSTLTAKKKKMVTELEAIDQRQNELDKIRQRRIEKGKSID